MGEEIDDQTVEALSVFPLRPVSALVENVQFGIKDACVQAVAHVDRHKTIVAAPDDEGLRLDFSQPRAEIGKLNGMGLGAFDEVIQVIGTCHEVGQAEEAPVAPTNARPVNNRVIAFIVNVLFHGI